VFTGWRRRQKYKPRHARLEDQGIARVEPDDHSLSDPIHGGDGSSHDAAAQHVNSRMDRNRAFLTGWSAHVPNPAADDRKHAAPHRFDFR
jgi:hypothetical protein